MADSTLYGPGIPALVTPSADDLVYVLHDPSGSPSNGKVRIDRLGKVAHKIARRESTDLTVTQTARTNALDTALDITLNATIGDVLEITPAFMVANNNANNDIFQLDVATIVSAAVVNWVSGSGSTTGVPAWNRVATVTTHRIGVSGAIPYTVVAGDISGGTVKLSLYAFVTAGSYNVYARVVAPFVWMVKNIGPVAT